MSKYLLLIVVSLTMVMRSVAVFAAPATWIQSVTYNGETITMRLTKENLRGSNFELWEQNSSGGYDVVTPVEERSYIGTVDEYPGAISCGILGDDGTFRGAVYFDRGVSWFTSDNAVDGTRALNYATFSAFQYPSAPTVQAGQAGSVMYGFEVGVDADYNYFNTPGGGNIATAFEHIEYSVCLVRAIYMKDVLLQPYLGRVIIRASLPQDPYTGLTQGGYLGAVRTEWNNNHTDTDPDVVAGVSPTKIGGGLAWVGVVGTSSGYSVSQGSNSTGRFDVVWRHEMGHNWGSGHYVGDNPEGAGIMGGNSPARFSGCEAYRIFNHRDSRSAGILDNLGIYNSIDLPPYASLDAAEFTQTVTTLQTIDVLANDHDGNGQAVSLDSYDATSAQGGTVTLQGQDLIYTAPGSYIGDDYFLYSISDSTGQTATGAVVIGVQPNDPLRLYLPLDETSGTTAQDSSLFGKDGSLQGDMTFDSDSVAGSFGSALQFDGVDDYVKLPNLEIINSNTVTLTAWINRGNVNTDGYDGLIFTRSSSANGLNFTSTSNELGYHWNDSSSTYNWPSGLTVPANTWTFVALVVEPAQAKMYMDIGGGLLSATNAIAHAPASFIGSTNIGRDANGSRHFTGAMDEVRFYNYALTAAELEAVRDGGRAESPKPFDGAVDVSFPILSWAGSATAVQFDIYVGDSYDAVVNATTSSPEYRGRQGENEYHLPILYINTDYNWRIDCVDASNTVTPGAVWIFSTGDGTGSVIRQVWHNITGNYVSDLTGDPDYPDHPDLTDELSTFEAPTDWASNYGTRIYGYLIPQTTGSYTFWIASDDYGELWLSSDYDPVHATKIAQVPGYTNTREWNKYSQQQSNPITLVAGRAYYIQALQKEGGGDDNLAVAWQGPGINQQVIEGAYLSAGLLASPPSALVSHWNLDETAGTIVDDAVGNNDGVLMGDPTWQPTGGKFEGALDFDGSDDYVSLPYILNPAHNSFSAFAWVRLDEKAGDYQIILQQEDDNGRSWLFRDATDEKLKSYLGGQLTTSSTAVFSNTGEWHHVGLTYNGITLKLYIDGKEEASNDVTAESAYGTMRLGAFVSNSYPTYKYWNGLIDDVRIYNVALNTDQVTSAMNFRIGWWKLNETTGRLAADDAGGNRGHLFNFADDDSSWVSGKLDGALQFDGLADFVDLGNSTSLKPDLPLTLAAWIKLAEVGNYQAIINIDKKDYDDSHRIFGSQLFVRNTGELSVSFGDGLPNYSVRLLDGTTVLQPGVWYHVAAVFRSPADIRLYINGRDDGDEILGSGGAIAYSDGTAQIGSRSGDALFLNGEIDEVQIYNRALRPEEIAALARPLLDLNSNGLIGLVDLYLLSGDWLEHSCDPLSIADFDLDCNVDLTDYARLASQWMQAVN